MDKITKPPPNKMFKRLDPAKPLKPQSVRSTMILCEQEANLQQREFTNPFKNFKIELVNNRTNKRPLQDSSSDDGYETPAKKACSPKDVSPDLGCFMDFHSPPATEGSVSTFAICLPSLLDKTQTIGSELKGGAGSLLHSEHVECGSPTEPGVNEESVPHSLKCEKVLLNLAPAFDCDVDDILCLDTYGNVESSESPSSNTFQNNVPLIVSGPMLESHDSHVEPLEGNAEEAWDIGPPIFESSIFQVTVGGEEDTLETSYETTLPLQVKVKSVVVAPNQLTSSSKTAAPPQPEQTAPPDKPSTDEKRGSGTAKCVSNATIQRPEVFDKERDWDREKRLYVHSVTRHMKEHQGENQGVMTELLTLMNHVADQRPGTDGKQWQHPSDLTRRNYQRRFGNVVPNMTLHEWQSQNCPAHKRFAKVPKYFQRSHFP